MLTLTPVQATQSRQSSRFAPPPAAIQGLEGSLDPMGAPMSFARNEEIYGEGEPADYLYKVISGTVRVYRVLDDGRRQIAEFFLPGDMFGMEFRDQHVCSAEAVGTATVLVFKRSTVLALANRDNDVSRQIWEMTARELHRAQNHMMLLIKSAQERVASFLIEMSARTAACTEVDLPMSRQDIADYLGLTIETVSRTLTQFESEATIKLPTSRRIVLRNRAALTRLTA